MAYSNASNYVSTTAQYLDSIARYSNFDVRYVHVTNGAELEFDFNEFDAVLQSYCARLPFDNYLSSSFLEKLNTFHGIRLLAVQDEYEQTDKLKAGIQAIGYHAVFTCTPQDTVARVYPRQTFPQTEFITVLTGYVPEHLTNRGRAARPLRERPIYIGYRGRRLPAYYGKLGFDKFEIGRRMREICVARGIPHDIEWAEDKRIYGKTWYDFIGSCRANLGSETGSNVFDFDGLIKATYDRLAAARGGPVPFQEFRIYTDPIETQFDIGQISPRIFEAAAMRTPLILYSGRYLGAIEPDKHYIELKKDFSNVDYVLARLDDLDALEQMADRTHDRLVGSGEFSYHRFVKLIDETVTRKAMSLGVPLRPPYQLKDFVDTSADPAELGSLRELPTMAPHHPAVFLYKNATQYAASLSNETARLSNEIARQSNEIARLKGSIRTPRRRIALAEKVLANPAVRRLGHNLLASLPDDVGRRVKTGIGMLLSRL